MPDDEMRRMRRDTNEKLEQMLDRMGMLEERFGHLADQITSMAATMEAGMVQAIRAMQSTAREHGYHRARLDDKVERLAKRVDRLEDPDS